MPATKTGPPRRTLLSRITRDGSRRRVALLASTATIGATLPFLVNSPGGAAVTGFDVTYTTDADFDQGSLLNVNHDAPNNDQLQVNQTTSTFGFIWVALSQRCTIAKVDTVTGTILGEYRTVSDGSSCSQSSRTTVAQNGSVWVGDRGTSNPHNGMVTHVALRENNDCIDRNGNGTIETSSGYDDVLAWPGAGAPVGAAADECIVHHIDTGGLDSRHMSIDAAGDVWVGDRNGGSIFRKYDGDTGALIAGPHDFACGGYGGLIDGNGVIWSATPGGSILRWDSSQPPAAAQCLPYDNYGMAIDGSGNVWVSSLGGGVVRKFDPAGILLGTFPTGLTNSQGLAVGTDGDVWLSSSLFCNAGCSVARLNNDGTPDGGLIATPTGAGSTGVSVDGAGKIWFANLNAHTAVRIDPAGGPQLTVNFPSTATRPLPFPYNYSDMTGQQLLNTTSQGTWTVVQDSGTAGQEWGTVTWNTEAQGHLPDGAEILVEARTADTEAGLGSQTYAPVGNGVEFSMSGRFIQVRTTLTPNDDKESPVLSDIRIEAVHEADLSITKTDAADPVPLGGQIDYTLTVANDGPSGATGVTVTDDLPDGTTFVSAMPSQGTCGPPGPDLTCTLGNIAAGATATVAVKVTADRATTVSNTATVGATEPDPDTGNNSAAQTTTVAPKVSINDTTVTEGVPANPTDATLAVSLSGPADAPVTVNWATADGTAKAGLPVPNDDYAATNGTVTFLPGETSKPVVVQVKDDTADEPDEQFSVNLSAPSNAIVEDGQGVVTILDDERNGRFSCRATGVRLVATELGVANGPDVPCKDAASTLGNVNLSLLGVGVKSGTVNVSTDQTPDDLEATSPAVGDNGRASAQLEGLEINVGLTKITAGVLGSTAQVRCTAVGQAPALTGSSQITNLRINGNPVALVNGQATVNIPLVGTLHVGKQTVSGGVLTQRALWLEGKGLLSLVHLVVSEAKADVHGNPCDE